MFSIVHKYRGFYYRIYRDTNLLLIMLFVLAFFLISVKGIWGSVTAYFLISSLVISGAYNWNLYFIQQIDIYDGMIYLKVYKRNRIFINGQFSISEIELNVKMISGRSITYKLKGKVGGKSFTQYEVNGWRRQDFHAIIEQIK